jgi:hypothetical protein
MTHEIIFRGRRLDNGKWAEGLCCIFFGEKLDKYTLHIQAQFGDRGYLAYEVDPATVDWNSGTVRVVGSMDEWLAVILARARRIDNPYSY